ncbi:unnamed protein product [Vitrella brassicaformis CCMP3155]|uniref:Uncharacterized protein n=1 Tax=Vitrella brassicaformis (strain CCMP3155) TaxID=1169540 RepID=A0A0G4F886_VITBC|nr:unnamed protein product [Vitrella brassicaformis CCMP3155]|eukprot:CEM08578.1 unnamed protein product [Vitrella brassicaformis CCMP3155]
MRLNFEAFLHLLHFGFFIGAPHPDMVPPPPPINEEEFKHQTRHQRPTCTGGARRAARRRGKRGQQLSAPALQQASINSINSINSISISINSGTGSASGNWITRDKEAEYRRWTAPAAGQAELGDKEQENKGGVSNKGKDVLANEPSSSAASASATVDKKATRLQRVTLRDHELPVARAPVAEKMVSVLAEKIKGSGPSVVCNNKHANTKYNNGI